MSLNCRLNRNISLNQPSDSGGTDSCNSQDLSMGIGGIQSPLLIYNIDDVKSLKFEGDNRADESLVVDTINSVGSYYKVDFTSATYQEDYENNKWEHSIQLTISNITSLFEDLLSDASNGKYLVCFKPNGSEDYRMFGWKYGASLDYGMNIQDDSIGYTVTFADTSEYPLFTVYKDNFGIKDKVYTPIFTPLYNVYFCEHVETYTGYLVAMYVVKTNSAGQPLDADNKLCQFSGKKQDAYKYVDVADDGGYNIIGTYSSSAVFDGRPVKILDYTKCMAVVDDSIFINNKKIDSLSLNTWTTRGDVTISSSNSWRLSSSQPLDLVITPTTGNSGSTNVNFEFAGTVGGNSVITFQNTTTYETVELDVHINTITINSLFTYPNGTTEFILQPNVKGTSGDYTWSVDDPSVSVVKDGNGYLICHPQVSASQQLFEFRLEHADDPEEVVYVYVVIQAAQTSPNWQLLSSFCENI